MLPRPSGASPEVSVVVPDAERRSGAFPPPGPVKQLRRLSDAHDLIALLGVERPRHSLFDVVRANDALVGRIQEAVRTTLRVHSRSAIRVLPARSAGLPGQTEVAVIGVLRLTGSPGAGSMLALGLSLTAFAAIYENMFGEPLGELTEENQDLAGELVNIIFQTIDPDLRALGLELEPSLPAFLTGRAIEGWSQAAVGHSFVLPFSTDAGDLFIAIPAPRPGTPGSLPTIPSTPAEHP